MTSADLASLAGVVLSLLFAYVPKLKDWYILQDATTKAGVMAVALLAVSLGIFGAACLQLAILVITCDKTGAIGLLKIMVGALVANQATYVLFVRPGQTAKLAALKLPEE